MIQPTAVRFAPDGRAFIAEKAGHILVYDSVEDSTPSLVADFSADTWNFADHGLLGLAVDPGFPSQPYIYILHSMRGLPGGRLYRLQLDPSNNTVVGTNLLLEAWCEIYPSHSIGDLHFGPDGALYVSAGDGASFSFVDYGQSEPHNPDGGPGSCTCFDPPLEGGALRSQDLQTSGDPVSFNGAVLRLDPATGNALPNNPLYGGGISGDDRIIAYGLRNPFRFTIHPVTGALFIGDVGWDYAEEINFIPNPLDPNVRNFGWPCYEGPGRQFAYDSADLPICESLYASGTATAPFYYYTRANVTSSVSGLAVYTGENYPVQYYGALFFGDYGQQFIKVMFPGANGVPDPANVQTFTDHGATVVDIQTGENGDIFYVDIADGEVRRIQYFGSNNPPVAVITANPTSGPSPLTVNLSASQSYDPDSGDTLTYAWDLDGDGQYDDSTAVDVQHVFASSGNYLVRLRVTDSGGLSRTASQSIAVDNGPPTATILAPALGTTWRVGDAIAFSGEAYDPDTGAMPPSALSWQIILYHCAIDNPNDCHVHTIHTFNGISGGQFFAPDHEYPCYLEIRLTATETGGQNPLSDTVTLALQPETVPVTFQSNPPGIELVAYSSGSPTPYTRDFIVNAATSIAAPTPYVLNNTIYLFSSWSDGGAQTHNVLIGSDPTTFTATYTVKPNEPPVVGVIPNQMVVEGETLVVPISATDADLQTPVLAAFNLPSGASFIDHGDGTGTLSWPTQIGDAGRYDGITIRATDTGNPPLSAERSFTIRVYPAGSGPLVEPIPDAALAETQLLVVDVTASDLNGPPPSLAAGNMPPGASFVDNGNGTGTLSWQTDYDDAGVYPDVLIIATDAVTPSLQYAEPFAITVANVNRPPAIAPILDQSITAGATLAFDVGASDPDGAVPTLGISGLPAGAQFADHGNGTATLRWTPSAAQVGVHSGITVTANDNESPPLTDGASFSITVEPNAPPVLDPIGDRTVDENETLSFLVTAIDPEFMPLSLEISNLPAGAAFEDHGDGIGTFTWRPDYDAAGTYPGITITVTDSGDPNGSDSEMFSITVMNVDRPPVLDPIGDQFGVEQQPLSFAVSATDPDGDIPALRIANLPPGASFVDNGNGTGEFSWTPGYEGASFSPYELAIFASSAGLEDSRTVLVHIGNVNRPVSLNPVDDQSVEEGNLLQFMVFAQDADGTIPTLSALNEPSGAAFVDNGNGTGVFAWQVPLGAAAASPYAVTFVATDGESDATDDAVITVTPGGMPGEITVERPQKGDVWPLKKTKKIVRWTSHGEVGNNVRIELWRRGAYVKTLRGRTPNDGKWAWKSFDGIPEGRGYQVRISSVAVPAISDMSTGTFTISKGAR